MEPVGFWSSSLAHSRTSAEGESRGRPTSGVLPTESRAESKRTRTESVRGLAEPGLDLPDRAASPRDGWQYNDLVTVAHQRLEPTGEPHVLVVDVDVDEAPQVAVAVLGLDEPLLDARVVRLEVLDHLEEGGPFTGYGLLAAGVGAQDGGDADLDCHQP